jgi:hypothetical protein
VQHSAAQCSAAQSPGPVPGFLHVAPGIAITVGTCSRQLAPRLVPGLVPDRPAALGGIAVHDLVTRTRVLAVCGRRWRAVTDCCQRLGRRNGHRTQLPPRSPPHIRHISPPQPRFDLFEEGVDLLLVVARP